MLKQYVFNLLIAIDQLGNAVLGGDPDETISSRCAKIINRAEKLGVIPPPAWYWLARILEKIDPGHLKRSIEKDEGKQAVIRWIP